MQPNCPTCESPDRDMHRCAHVAHPRNVHAYIRHECVRCHDSWHRAVPDSAAPEPEPRPHIPIATLEECTKAESLPEGRDEPDAPTCKLCEGASDPKLGKVRPAEWTHIRGEYSWRHPLEQDRMMSVPCTNPGYVAWCNSRKDGGQVSLADAFSAGIAWQAKQCPAPRVEAQPDAPDKVNRICRAFAEEVDGYLRKQFYVPAPAQLRRATSEPGWISAHCDMCHEPVTGSVHYELVSGEHRCCRCMKRLEKEVEISGPVQDAVGEPVAPTEKEKS